MQVSLRPMHHQNEEVVFEVAIVDDGQTASPDCLDNNLPHLMMMGTQWK